MEWIKGPIIGRGSTATVSLASLIPSGELIAVKSSDSSMVLEKEQCLLSKTDSPYIVKYLGFNVVTNENKPKYYNLCMEYMPGGTLHDEIRRRKDGRLDEDMIRSYTYQILQGLNYLHSNGLAHCDIKSHNVLISKDGGGGVAKIADLGCAKFVSEDVFSGTPLFMAPEVARREEQGFAADIWALGCTIIEMATGMNPWPELSDPVSALYRIGFSGEVPEIPKWLSVEGRDFLSKCLVRDHKERWVAQELLDHPFFDEVVESEFKMRSSPCTVLDSGFWDSLEVIESPENSTHNASSSSSNSNSSGVKRIQQLISSIPNWSFEDEDWITVRSNDNDEISEEEEEREVQDFNEEDFLVESTVVENSSNFSIMRDDNLELSSEFVLENLNFEIDNEKIYCLINSISFCLQSFFFF